MTRDELCPLNIYTTRGLPGVWIALDLRGSLWIVPADSADSGIRPYRGHTAELEEVGSWQGPLGSLFDLDIASPVRIADRLRSIETPSALIEATERVVEHLPDDDTADVLRRVPDAVDALPRSQLVTLLRSSNPQVRSLALQALEHVPGPRASMEPDSPTGGAR